MLDFTRNKNQGERFLGFVTEDLLRRSDHHSVQALETKIRKWVNEWNTSPTPFTWTKTAEQILATAPTPPNAEVPGRGSRLRWSRFRG
ncbi:hypothetical protein QFZ36_003662 [Pseudarthrobacter siccitolerans]|uniref:Transposase n=1 Tax=Pseudarthrobacter siccitolerans TaxID=861266 RepID=A0ABU0PS89_9MICC|nr:hypothetical protein [Pseudarthrobacter siccitolerans]MDQ0676101.1 hypothetical protein [Pseudarthrobacter siccitolerans]